MSALSDKYCTEEELFQYALGKGIKAEYFVPLFQKFEDEVKIMTDEEESGIGDFANFKIFAMNYSCEYFKVLQEEVNKGHSAKWAKIYTEYRDEEEKAFYHAFKELFRINKNDALNELHVYCNFINADETYKRFFMKFMLERETITDDVKPKQAAEISSKTYKKYVSLGYPEIFCDLFSTLTPYENEVYCLTFARTYQESIDSGKSVIYAK